jgi:hypothetical protein
MDAVELKFETTRRDWVAFYFKQFIERRDTRLRLLMWTFVPPTVLAALVLLIASHVHNDMVRMAVKWIAFLIFPVHLSLVYGVVLRRARDEADRSIKAGKFIGFSEVTLSERGVSVTRGSDSTFKNWKEIPRPTANSNYGFLYLSLDDIVVIPCRGFSDPKAFEMFMKNAILFQWHGENAVKAAAEAPAKKSAPEPVEVERLVVPMLAAGKDSCL